MNGKLKHALACATCVLLLAGCVSPIRERAPSESPAQDILVEFEAPAADAIADRAMQAALYFLTPDGSQLRAFATEVAVRGGESEAEAVLRVLLSGSAPQGLRPPLPGGLLQTDRTPVIVAGGVATVMLSPAARTLEPGELFAARMAIANTLTELPSISYVNVLVEGMEAGIAPGSNVPFGTLARQPNADVDAAWRHQQALLENVDHQGFSKLITVYVPVPGGRYIIPQVRNVTFADAQATTLIRGVLWEISKGAAGATGADQAPALPDLNYYLYGEPEELMLADGFTRVIRFTFYDAIGEELANCGVSRGMLCALLTQSVTSLLPHVRGVQVRIGIDALIDLGEAESPDGRPLSASGDMWTPAHFWDSVGALASIPLPNHSGARLVKVDRPVRATERLRPRALLGQLLLGPQPADARQDLLPALPPGVSDEDFLAISLQDGVALVNLSARFAQACRDLNEWEERNAVYAIVNLLTEFSDVRRVAFFVEGAQVRSLAGGLEMRGVFYRNPGLFE
ncbi:MAG: GerMN domain-containing protein [Clostridia bacterium]|nr:GerMN domain-containing protein [Clostridia bacterium]